MSANLGGRASQILKILEEEGPMTAAALVARRWEPLRPSNGGAIPYSFDRSTKQAIGALVAKGKVLSFPEFRGANCAKAILWLAGKAPPEGAGESKASVEQDGIPSDMCPNCGVRCQGGAVHMDLEDCIDALRAVVARLQFGRPLGREEREFRT